MRHALVVSAMTLAVGAVGCATEAPGQPVPVPSDVDGAPPTSTSASPTGEAPPINSPELDLTRYESRPCDLLTPAQLAPFSISAPGEPDDDVTGPSCTWKPSGSSTGARIDLGIFSKVREGLAGIYARKDRFVFFEDAGEINGYPAVHLDTASDGHAGVCVTVIGVRRDLAFEVAVHVRAVKSPEYKNPCSLSDKAASSVIDTVRGGR